MELGSGLAILGAAVGSKQLLQKILGPTADYLGEGVRDFTKKAFENIAAIFRKTSHKLGKRVDEKGAIPPQILIHVLTEGAYAKQSIEQEYLAGVLAASRTDTPADNRLVAFASMISQMSNYQIRSHYLFYRAIRECVLGKHWNFGVQEDRAKAQTLIDSMAFHNGMNIGPEIGHGIQSVLEHVLYGLLRLNLIEKDFAYGSPGHLRKFTALAKDSGLVVQPSVLGIQLYFVAHGMSDAPVEDYLKKKVELEPLEDVKLEGAYYLCWDK